MPNRSLKHNLVEREKLTRCECAEFKKCMRSLADSSNLANDTVSSQISGSTDPPIIHAGAQSKCQQPNHRFVARTMDESVEFARKQAELLESRAHMYTSKDSGNMIPDARANSAKMTSDLLRPRSARFERPLLSRYIYHGPPARQLYCSSCCCKVDPDFESFRAGVRGILKNIQREIQGLFSSSSSLDRSANALLVDANSRLSRCQNDIELFVQHLSDTISLRGAEQVDILCDRSMKKLGDTNMLLKANDDAVKVLSGVSTNPAIREARVVQLEEQLSALRKQLKHEQAINRKLIDTSLAYAASKVMASSNVDAAQESDTPTPPSLGASQSKGVVSGSQRSQSSTRKPTVTNTRGETLTRKVARDVQMISVQQDKYVKQLQRQLAETEAQLDKLRCTSLATESRCGVICPHELALTSLKKALDQQRLKNAKDLEEATGRELQSHAEHASRIELLEGKCTRLEDAVRKAYREAYLAAKSEFDAQAGSESVFVLQRMSELEQRNIELIKENTRLRSANHNIRAQLITTNLMHSVPCDCTAVGTEILDLSVKAITAERDKLKEVLVQKDTEIIDLQHGIDGIMSEMMDLHASIADDDLDKKRRSPLLTSPAKPITPILNESSVLLDIDRPMETSELPVTEKTAIDLQQVRSNFLDRLSATVQHNITSCDASAKSPAPADMPVKPSALPSNSKARKFRHPATEGRKRNGKQTRSHLRKKCNNPIDKQDYLQIAPLVITLNAYIAHYC